MSQKIAKRQSNIVRTLEKFALSGFVVCSFLAYGLHERFSTAGAVADAIPPTQAPTADQPAAQAAPQTGAQTSAQSSAQSAPQPTQKPAPTPTNVPPTQAPKVQGMYKDGSYTGPIANTFYGPVQVRATVQNGKLQSVQFLQYPSDRRTSQRINQQVMPWLQSEAVQAQNANVDIITGATLTSEAFVQSLQAALSNARTGL